MSGVSGSTIVITELGPLTIGQIATLHSTDFGLQDYKGPKIFLENGHMVMPRLFYIGKPAVLMEITLATGVKHRALGAQNVLTNVGYVAMKFLTSKHHLMGVKPHFNAMCLVPNNTIPVVDLSKHAEYVQNTLISVKITGKTTYQLEPQFNFGIPYYNRFVGNGIINHD